MTKYECKLCDRIFFNYYKYQAHLRGWHTNTENVWILWQEMEKEPDDGSRSVTYLRTVLLKDKYVIQKNVLRKHYLNSCKDEQSLIRDTDFLEYFFNKKLKRKAHIPVVI